MTFTSTGYDGTVDETQFARLMVHSASATYGVAGLDHFQVSAVAGQDRVVQILGGTAWGPGVVDQSSATETVQLASVSSGSRWDMIVLRRDWQPPGGATTVAVIQGGASNLTLPSRNVTPGVLDDQPLAYVRVDEGSTVIGSVIDLRCWARNGGCVAKDTRVMDYLDGYGTELRIGRSSYSRVVYADNSSEWQKSHDTYMKFSGAATYTLSKDVTSGHNVRVNFPDGYFLSGVMPNLQITVVDRVSPRNIGRFNVEARDVSHTGFSFWAYRTELSEARYDIEFVIHWLAFQ